TGVAGSVVGVDVVVVVLDVDVVLDLVATRRWRDLATCADCPPDVIAPTSTHVPATATTAMTTTAAKTNRLRLDAACRRIRRSIAHALSCRSASGGCYAEAGLRLRECRLRNGHRRPS